MRAGDEHGVGATEIGPLGLEEVPAPLRGETLLEGERMVHHPDDRGGDGRESLGREGAEDEPVDDQRTIRRHRRQCRRGLCVVVGCGIGEGAAEPDELGRRSRVAQPVQEALLVEVAAGHRLQVAGYGEGRLDHVACSGAYTRSTRASTALTRA